METKEQWADTNRTRSTRSPARLAVIVFIVAAGVLLILEHRARWARPAGVEPDHG